MSPIDREWQHDGSADGEHCDPLRDVLIEPRPWPKLNGATWFAILFGGEIALMLGAWLVTK